LLFVTEVIKFAKKGAKKQKIKNLKKLKYLKSS